MCRDVLIHSMNRGQFLGASLFVIILLIIYKMPGQDVSKLVFDLTGKLFSGFVGWIVAGVSLIGWLVHAKAQRRMITLDMKRLAKERDKWQKKFLMHDGIKSSEEE